MNIAKAYTKGFIQTAKYPRMWFILYFANLFLALLLALPFFSALNANFGHSDFYLQLLDGYDATVVNEFNYYFGDALKAVFSNIKWVVLAYFLLSIFLTGGIIRTLNEDKFSTSSFFGGSAYSFFRILGLSILISIAQIIFLIAIGALAGIIIDNYKNNFSSELSYLTVAGIAAAIYFFIFIIFNMASDYGKFYMELNDTHNIFKAFWNGIKYVFKHFLKTMSLYLILLFLPAVIMYVYLYFEKDYKMATSVGILIVFLMQQTFILLRVFLRTWILSSELKLYDDDFLKLSEVQEVVQSIVEQKVKEIENKQEVFSESVKSSVKTKEEPENPEKVQNEEKKDIASDYEINFEETFTKNEKEENVLSEEEILRKMEEEGHDESELGEEISTETNEHNKENDIDEEDEAKG